MTMRSSGWMMRSLSPLQLNQLLQVSPSFESQRLTPGLCTRALLLSLRNNGHLCTIAIEKCRQEFVSQDEQGRLIVLSL